MTKNQTDNELDQLIMQTLKEQKPETVNQLVTLTKEKTSQPEQQILKHILNLQQNEKLHLTPTQTPPPQTLSAYIRTNKAGWYWTTLALTLATMLTVYTVPEDTTTPLKYVRYVLGAIFILFLPGYTFIKALFPTQVPIKTGTQDLDNIERIALSLGLSIALVPMIGLLLNYTPWGITLTPITLSLTALTLAFATAAIIREHQTTKTTTMPP